MPGWLQWLCSSDPFGGLGCRSLVPNMSPFGKGCGRPFASGKALSDVAAHRGYLGDEADLLFAVRQHRVVAHPLHCARDEQVQSLVCINMTILVGIVAIAIWAGVEEIRPVRSHTYYNH